MHSTFKWESVSSPGDGGKRDKEVVLQGLVRVPTEATADALKQSGRAAVFFSLLAKESKAVRVQWLEAPQHSGGVGYYLQFARAEASRLGGALAYRRGGGKALGMRLPERADASVPLGITWRLRGVPLAWEEAELEQALRGVGIQGTIKVVDRTPGKPWLVRITHDAPTTDMAFVVEVPRHRTSSTSFGLSGLLASLEQT